MLVVVTWQIFIISKNLIVMTTSKGVQESTFQQKAVTAVKFFTENNDPKEVLKTFKSMYDGYVESDLFIQCAHYDYRAIEQLIENIIDAAASE